jgi:hypothetical protein
MLRLKHQRQKLSSNCGPACVAILARINQDRACRAMFGKAPRQDYSSDWADIRRALTRLDLRFGQRVNRVSTWQKVPAISIVACRGWTKGSHLVVCSPAEGLIYDPRRNQPAPFSRTRRRPISYLAVTPRRRATSRARG